MALVKFSGNITEIIGRMGGSVFQRTKGGIIMRPQGRNLNSSKSNIYRARVNATNIQQAWQALSVQDRQLWEVYAQFRNRPSRKNSLIPLGGQATFMLENSIRVQFEQNFGVISPTILTTPVLTAPPQTVTIQSMTNTGFALEISTDYSIPDDTKFLFMYISRPLLPSQLSVWNKKKLIANMSATGQTQAITGEYTALWGALPSVGQEVNTEIFLYDKNISTFGAGNAQRLTVV